MALKCSSRSELSTFIVMDVMAKAAVLEKQGNHIIHLEVGQPSTGAPAAASQAIINALDDPRNHGYVMPLGIDPLRRGIAAHYKRLYGLDISADNVAVTVGSSLGFAMAFLICFEQGDRIAITNPGYSAYRNLMTSLGIEVVNIPAGANEGWIPQIKDLDALDPRPDGLIVASPSNPTGAVIREPEMKALAEWCHNNGVRLISDEIYHGVTFDVEGVTALKYSPSAIVVNSFSKYFSMTGHRIGWMVVPDDLVDPIERLAQNLVISVPTLLQIGAAEAITNKACLDELDRHVERYRVNRDILLDSLPEKFLGKVAPPEGAFYIYADISQISNDSLCLADRLLNEAHVATTTGFDFDPEGGHLTLRLSFAGTTEDIKEGARRITEWVKSNT